MRQPASGLLCRVSAATLLTSIIGLLLPLLTGCAGGKPYTPPALPQSEVATLKGKNATYIKTIDGMDVKQGTFILGLAGGNETTATPGLHRIEVEGWVANSHRTFPMQFDLAKAAVYVFKTASLGRRLTILNETTGRTWTFDGQTLTFFDPDGKPLPGEKPIAP